MPVSVRRGKGANSGANHEQQVVLPYLPRAPLAYCQHLLGWFAGLDDVLGRVERMEQGLPGAVPHASQKTSDTSGDETDDSEPRRRVRRKKCFKMKKVWGASDLVVFS